MSDILYPKISKNDIKGSNIQWSETSISEDKCTFVFTIRNYSLLKKKFGEFIESPEFTMEHNKNIRWFLQMLPSGKYTGSQDDSKEDREKYLNCIALYLMPNFKTVLELKTSFSFSIVGKDKKNYFKRNITYDFYKDKKNIGWGIPNLISNETLNLNKENLLPNDTLTICCSIVAGINMDTFSKIIPNSELDDNVPVNKKFKPNSNVDNLEKMYLDSKYYDVTFVVGDKKIKAHKCLLAAVSPIFDQLLSNGKKLANKVINITDVSFEIMNELIKFIYTKKISNLQDIAHELIAAANNYLIEDLKNICEETLGKSVNLENVLEMYVIANDNNAETLKNLALNFITKNKKKLATKLEFQEMIESNPEFIKEIFMSEVN